MSNEIRSLTGLRGAAALYVVFHHLLSGRDSTGAFVQKFVSKGYVSVDVFFILSGLVMAMTYRGMFEGRYRPSAQIAFLLKRVARIYPLYVVVLVASVLVSASYHEYFSLKDLICNLFLVQSWDLHVKSIVGPAWSISTETAAYLVFPLLVIAALRSSVLVCWAIFAMSCVFICACTVPLGPSVHGSLDVWDGMTPDPLLRCIGGFTIGLLLFRAAALPRLRDVAGADAFSVAVAVLLVLGIAWGVNDLVLYPLFPALVLSLYVNQGWPAKAAGSPPLHWLGLLSYAIYLVHSLVIEVLWPASQGWLAAYSTRTRGMASTILCIGVVILLARFLHSSVEKPGRAWVRRLA